MSDEEPESQAVAVRESKARPVRTYGEEDRAIILAALDLNAGNVMRTARAFQIPDGTLRTWRDKRDELRKLGLEPQGYKEVRGDLATKLEDKLHSVVESITPHVIEAATLSQRGVFLGIGVDKVKILRSTGLDPDPESELCRLLNINRAQLPADLALAPGEELPPGFQDIIEMQPNQSGTFEPVPPLSPRYHHPDLGTLQTDSDQANLPQGYIRLSQGPASYTLKLSELSPLPEPHQEDDNDQMLSTIPDDDQEN